MDAKPNCEGATGKITFLKYFIYVVSCPKYKKAHTSIQLRQTDTDTHNHGRTHTHTHTQTYTNKHMHTNPQTCPHTQSHKHKHTIKNNHDKYFIYF